MFEALQKLLVENPGALAELSKIKGNYDSLSTEVSTLEGKLSEAITKKDKYKNFTKSVKGKLGIEEGEELTEDTLNSKIEVLKESLGATSGEKEKVLKLELLKLEEAVKTAKLEAQDEVARVNGSVLESKLELELYKTTSGVSAVNERAHKMIIDELKAGAVFEEGKIVFKGQDGTTVRQNGVAMTLNEKLEGIKSSEDMSFLFKSDAKSGSGTHTGDSGTGTEGMSQFAKDKIAKARAAGIDIKL